MNMTKNLKLYITAFTIIFTVFLGGISVQADFGDTTLRYGMRGTDVITLQTKLKSKGYFSATATGYFGAVTKSAVISFQRAKGLTADGVVGPKTFSALNATSTVSRSSESRAKSASIIATAKSYMGVPYVWGGTSPKGFDCSGFVNYVFLKNGITLPRTAATIYQKGTAVSKANLLPGDLVFFSTYAPGASHVGIYIGNGDFIHASSSKGVTINDLSNSYYSERYIGAKRVL